MLCNWQNFILASRFLHIILSFLVLFSSTGLLVNQHFCRSELKHTALFAPAKRCHAQAMANCPMHAAAQKEQKGCCDDESHFLKHKQEQVHSETELAKAPAAMALPAPCTAFQGSLPSIDKQTIQYLNYKPPLIVCDLSVSLQTFLF